MNSSWASVKEANNADKLRGGYYTAPEIAEWLCAWAIRSRHDRVLEPSCGDGIFLLAAARRLRRMGLDTAQIARQLRGIEIAAEEAAKSIDQLAGIIGAQARQAVECEDFFEWHNQQADARFNCVVGNPPFIRYQNFPEPARSRAMALLTALGLKANRLTNIWVPFVAAAVAHLAPGGRLAMVLPAELLQVSYAAQLRTFLAEHFAQLDIIACNELLFERAEQEVVLLLADGRNGAADSARPCSIDLVEAGALAQMPVARLRRRQRTCPKRVNHDSEKWLKYFLTAPEISLMRDLKGSAGVSALGELAQVDVGVVTGCNDFFVLGRADVQRHGLGQSLLPLVGRSAQLRGCIYRHSDWQELEEQGQRVFLFYIEGDMLAQMSDSAKAYVALGKSMKVCKGYKCSMRHEWFRVPSVWIPDAFLFRQIYDFPRLVLNQAGATSTDTIHRVRCLGAPEDLARRLYTHMTAASAEIEGRSYGGGVLELEPTEAERLLVPREASQGLPIAEVDGLVRRGRIEEALCVNDGLVLRAGLGISQRDCDALRRIWHKMRDRRMSRKRRVAASA